MLTTIRNDMQSRRQVQRRFPPGSFIINHPGDRIALVVGWGPTESTLRQSITEPSRMLGRPRSWVAYIIEDNRIKTVMWEVVRDGYTMEEWEALREAGP